MVDTLPEKNENQKITFTNLLVNLAGKSSITLLPLLVISFFFSAVGHSLDPNFILYLFFALLLPDIIFWGLDKFLQYFTHQHSKPIAFILSPLISIVAFWVVFCRCPLNTMLSGGHWQVLAVLLPYPIFRLVGIFWEIFRPQSSETQ